MKSKRLNRKITSFLIIFAIGISLVGTNFFTFSYSSFTVKASEPSTPWKTNVLVVDSDISSENYTSRYYYDTSDHIYYNISNIFNEGARRGDTHYYRVRSYSD